jgi:tetratricopeptide (TPR) repeat protein
MPPRKRQRAANPAVRPSIGRRVVLPVAGGLVLAAVVAAAVLGRAGGRPSPAGPIILISVDTLRADRVGAYGYRRASTPVMDRLASEGVLFERALSHSPQTLPAHASILGGRLPFQHGVRDNIGFSVGPGERLLPSLLRERGYRSAGFVSAFVLRRETGIGAGFDLFDAELPPAAPGASMGSVRREGADTVRRAREWLAAQQDGRFLLFVHLYEPHRPWRVPAGFGGGYDGAVSYADSLVGQFLDGLRERGLYDASLIVLLSDHGEGLGDHGEEEHGVFLYDEATRVPLIVRLPGGLRAGARVKESVQHLDVLPTLLEHAGATGAPALEGRSLLPLLQGRRDSLGDRGIYAEALYPRYHFGWSELYSLTDGRYRFVLAPTPELYDLRQDPGERNNLAASRASTAGAMRRALESRITGTIDRPSPVSAEDQARFQALGYIGQTASPVATSGGSLPDPKANIHVLERYREAVTLVSRRQLVEAIEIFREVVNTQPSMFDVWVQLGHALMRAGRHREAIEALRRSVDLDPGAADSLLAIAVGHLRLGELPEAREHARLALEREPARAREILARVALARGDAETAMAEAKRAQEADPTIPLPAYIEGALRHRRGDYVGAIPPLERAAQQAVARRLSIRDLHFTLADSLAHVGRQADAEAAFQAEIRAFPENSHARASLALLYQAQGRPADATRALAELVRATPTPESYALAVRTLEIAGRGGEAAGLLAQARRRFPQSEDLQGLPSTRAGGRRE